jgi:hypothetical protein
MTLSFGAYVAELVDATDLKSVGPQGPCQFESGRGHHSQRMHFLRKKSSQKPLINDQSIVLRKNDAYKP